MGFSIELFFDELFAVLEAEGSAEGKLEELKECINFNYGYAKECGAIKDD